jgi:hypothetical protein
MNDQERPAQDTRKRDVRTFKFRTVDMSKIRYPYLVVRLIPAVYGITELPKDWPVAKLLETGLRVCYRENKDVCVVLEPGKCCYFDRVGGRIPRHETVPPSGGFTLRMDLESWDMGY